MNLLNLPDGTIIRANINGNNVELEYIAADVPHFLAANGIKCNPDELQNASNIVGVEWEIVSVSNLFSEFDYRSIVDGDGDKWDYCAECDSWWCWDSNESCPHGEMFPDYLNAKFGVVDIASLFGIKARVR